MLLDFVLGRKCSPMFLFWHWWPEPKLHNDRSCDRNPNKLDHFDRKNFSIFELNNQDYLDYYRSYHHNAVIVLATELSGKVSVKQETDLPV